MLRQYRPLNRGEFIVVGGDCSSGMNDYSVCQFVSKNKRDVPMVWTDKVIASDMTLALQPILEAIFDVTLVKPLIAYERNFGGDFELDKLRRMNTKGRYEIFEMPIVGQIDPGQPRKYGWDTNTSTRPAMLQELKEAIDNQLIGLYDKQTVEELFSFVLVQHGGLWKAEAERGAHDDHIMSLAIAWQLVKYSASLQKQIQKSKKLLITRVAKEYGIHTAAYSRTQRLTPQHTKRRAY